MLYLLPVFFITGSPVPGRCSANTCWIIEWLAEWKYPLLDFKYSAFYAWTSNICLVDDMLLYFNPLCVQNSESAVDCFGIALFLRWVRAGVQNCLHQHPINNDGTDIYAVKGNDILGLHLEMVKSLFISLSFTFSWFRAWTLQWCKASNQETVGLNKSCWNLLEFYIIMTTFIWWQRSSVR